MWFSHLMDKLAARPLALAFGSFALTAFVILPDRIIAF
jgi:hypothetical protein